jgi:hypothetical protein
MWLCPLNHWARPATYYIVAVRLLGFSSFFFNEWILKFLSWKERLMTPKCGLEYRPWNWGARSLKLVQIGKFGWTDKDGAIRKWVIGVRTLDKEIAWGNLLLLACMVDAVARRSVCKVADLIHGQQLSIIPYVHILGLLLPVVFGHVRACYIKNCCSCWILWHRTCGMG